MPLYKKTFIIFVYFHKVKWVILMIKLRKFALIISIVFAILYAMDILFGFTFFFSYLHTHEMTESLFAFTIAISAFLNMLLFPHIHS